MRLILTFIFTLTLVGLLNAQNGEIFGSVIDNNGQPLIGANIIVQNSLRGTATDSKGNFKIKNLPYGNYRIIVSAVGYKKVTSDIIHINSDTKKVNFILEPTSYQFDQLIVTANKYSKDKREIAASSYVIDQQIFAKKNYRQIDDALRYIPGVTMTADQLSIRGSSGYSRGAGTRVLVAIDGIPIYSPDSGDIIWELIPITEIGRVEVIKGPASSLYGSSAIGGVVNILPKEISSNPVTYIKFQNGVYSNPSHNEWKWNNKTLTFNSQTITHSNSIGKLNFSTSFTRLEDYSYRKNDYQLRFAGYLKANYNFTESTSINLFGTGYTRDKETFNYWKNIKNALSPPDEDIGQITSSDRTILGLKINHLVSDKLYISLIPSAYLSFWKDDSKSKNKSDSKLFRTELRTNYTVSNDVKIISGAEILLNKVKSNIFGDRTSQGYAVYVQSDYKPIQSVNLSLGLRYDYSKLEDLDITQSLSPKFGITYQLNDNTTLKGMVSKGFRSPTLAEAFTSTSASGIIVKPNPDIRSEISYSIESGINHRFNNDLSVELSIFNSEYYHMIEPGFDPDDGKVFFSNITRARIQGIELNTFSSPVEDLYFSIGYTYLWARDVNNDKALNYRPRHTLISSINYENTFYQIGFDFRYLSRVESIDNEFVDLGIIKDGENRVDIIVLDGYLGINLFRYNLPGRIFIKANNILNYNYVELIGNISPIRNYVISLEIIF